MRNFLAVLMVFVFVANVLLSAVGSLILCAHSDYVHIVDSSTHSHVETTHSDNCNVSFSDCFDVFLGATISDFSESVSLKIPLPILKDLPQIDFFILELSSSNFGRDFILTIANYRPPLLATDCLIVPLLI